MSCEIDQSNYVTIISGLLEILSGLGRVSLLVIMSGLGRVSLLDPNLELDSIAIKRNMSIETKLSQVQRFEILTTYRSRCRA
jgi:hypothetical protein